jgi:flagellar hook-basal body complex protein FliE
MPAPISSLPAVNPIELARPAGAPQRAGGAFQDALSAAIKTVEGQRNDAAASVEQFLSGEGGELHSTVLAAQRAELSFDLFLQARNKVVNAYQEIMRMQM